MAAVLKAGSGEAQVVAADAKVFFRGGVAVELAVFEALAHCSADRRVASRMGRFTWNFGPLDVVVEVHGVTLCGHLALGNLGGDGVPHISTNSECVSRHAS